MTVVEPPASAGNASTSYPAVAEYREILLWPLALEPVEGVPIADVVRRQVEALSNQPGVPWTRIPDPLFHLPAEVGEPGGATQRQEPYAEFVYFHDFVRAFLYPSPDEHKAGTSPLQVFTRRDIGFVRITPALGQSYLLRVDRCNLYLFRLGVAVLAFEVTTEGCPGAINLRDVMVLQDIFRRVYTPYFGWNAKGYSPGLVPTCVEWLDVDQNAFGTGSRPPGLDTAIATIMSEPREPPVFAHWSDLIGLHLRGSSPKTASPAVATWRHIVDERMPFLAFVRLAPGVNLSSVYRGDWIRLCFADAPDLNQPQGSYFYDENFLVGFEKDHCYDRFFSSGTRHMFAGFSYVMVMQGNFDPPRQHFRHMYFQMALIAHLEFATYLTFSSRLSAATRKQAASREPFREQLLRIHEDFLEFVHLFRFTGISTQMQAQDMFDQWRKHLRLNALLADVKDELETATNYHFAYEARAQTNAANRLNVIAVSGVAAGLTFGFLGMNLMWDGTTVDKMLNGDWTQWLPRFAWGTLITCGTLWIALVVTRRAANRLLSGSHGTTPQAGIDRVVRRAGQGLIVAAALSVLTLGLGKGFGWW